MCGRGGGGGGKGGWAGLIVPRCNAQEALSRRDSDSMGSMKHAVKVGNMNDVRALLREGFDINSVDYDGRTVLHIAASAGDIKLVEMLVKEFDASVGVVDR